jgi:hypothetical protein
MTHRSLWFAIALLLATHQASAQSAAPMVFPIDPIQLLLNLLGTNAAFTATAQVSGEGPKDQDNFYMDVTYTMLGDALRTVTDLAKLRSRNACSIAQGHLQEMGLDETVMIRLPGLKSSFVVYPRARAYVEMPLTWHEDLKQITDLQKKSLGTTTLEGHQCELYQIHVTNAVGEENDVMVWEATDLNNFPLKIRFDIAPSVYIILFQNVQLSTPDVSLFYPPLDYDRYASLAELLRARRNRLASPE